MAQVHKVWNAVSGNMEALSVMDRRELQDDEEVVSDRQSPSQCRDSQQACLFYGFHWQHRPHAPWPPLYMRTYNPFLFPVSFRWTCSVARGRPDRVEEVLQSAVNSLPCCSVIFFLWVPRARLPTQKAKTCHK